MPEEKKSEQSKTKEEKKEKSSFVPVSAQDRAGKKASEGEEKEVKVPEKFKSLIAEIEKMSVLDLAHLVKILEEKFGVTAQAPVVVGVPSEAPASQEKKEEKTSFEVELTEAGPNKIAVIKAIRQVSQLGLKEAKDLVEAAPRILKEKVEKKEALEIKKNLEEAGARVTLR